MNHSTVSATIPAVSKASIRPRWNPWPWAVSGWFVFFFLVVVGLTTTAVRSRTDVVAGDYYAQELRFQEQLDAASRSDQLGITPKVSLESASGQLKVELPSDARQGGAVGFVTLYRPDNARLDRQVPMAVDGDGIQRITTEGLAPGRWRVRLAWTASGRSYYQETVVRIRPTL